MEQLSCKVIAWYLQELINDHKELIQYIPTKDGFHKCNSESIHKDGKLAIDNILQFLVKINKG